LAQQGASTALPVRLQVDRQPIGPFDPWMRRLCLSQVDLAASQLKQFLRLVAGVSTLLDFGLIDAIGCPESLDCCDAMPPGVQGDVLERSQAGGMAGHEFLAGELGPAELRRVVLVPPDAGLLLPLELLAPSVQVGEAAIEPF
jgi:hypothetical protein